jgi:hypothetical protein
MFASGAERAEWFAATMAHVAARRTRIPLTARTKDAARVATDDNAVTETRPREGGTVAARIEFLPRQAPRVPRRAGHLPLRLMPRAVVDKGTRPFPPTSHLSHSGILRGGSAPIMRASAGSHWATAAGSSSAML